MGSALRSLVKAQEALRIVKEVCVKHQMRVCACRVVVEGNVFLKLSAKLG